KCACFDIETPASKKPEPPTPKKCKCFESLGKCECDKARLCRMSMRQMLEQCKSGSFPSKGGVNEGGGSAPINWSHDTKEDGTKFKEEVLPPGDLAKLKLIGLSQVDPQKGKEASQGGALTNAAAGGGSANAQVILPRHKQAVEKYFLRPPPKN